MQGGCGRTPLGTGVQGEGEACAEAWTLIDGFDRVSCPWRSTLGLRPEQSQEATPTAGMTVCVLVPVPEGTQFAPPALATLFSGKTGSEPGLGRLRPRSPWHEGERG